MSTPKNNEHVVPKHTKADSSSTLDGSKDQANDSSSLEGDTGSKIVLDDKYNHNDSPMLLIAVLLKEVALDSPTFRSSMNHINNQFEGIDRWLNSFIGATQKVSQEMEGMYLDLFSQGF